MRHDPVFDARQNLRELCKHLGQAEEHLRRPDRRCADCVDKHLQLAESYADEVSSLDTTREYGAEARLAQRVIRMAYAELEAGVDPLAIAAQIRQLRKACAARARRFELERGATGWRRFVTPRNIAMGAGAYALYRFLR